MLWLRAHLPFKVQLDCPEVSEAYHALSMCEVTDGQARCSISSSISSSMLQQQQVSHGSDAVNGSKHILGSHTYKKNLSHCGDITAMEVSHNSAYAHDGRFTEVHTWAEIPSSSISARMWQIAKRDSRTHRSQTSTTAIA